MADIVDVLITLPFTGEQISRLQQVSPRLNIQVARACKPDEITLEQWKKVEVLYTSRAIPNVEWVPNLRWIQFHWAGIDHAVDFPVIHNPELIATTLSGAVITQVAEYVLMMFLSWGHHLPNMLNHQRRGEWPKDRWDRFSPVELRDSTVGIVGYGSIGRQVARLLHSFGAKVLATKRDVMHPNDYGYIPEGYGDPLGDYVHRLYPPAALKAMLKECDFVVVTIPLSPTTKNLIGAGELAALKPSAFIVDVSRGGVIDQEALVACLRERKIAGAALDVFPEEPLPDDSPLWKLNNVILTPHISGNSPWYDDRAITLFSENLRRYLTGQPLFNRFDPQLGY